MDIGSDQVSQLLALAAAMSAAQEKATGNGKLDMAGIMAALAMAQGEQRSRGVTAEGEKGEGSLPRGPSLIREEKTSVILHQGKMQDKKLEKKEKENKFINEKKIDGEDFGIQPRGKTNTFETLRRESSSMSLFRSPKPYKKFEEPNEMGETLREQSTNENKLAQNKLPVTRADLTNENGNIVKQDNAEKKPENCKTNEINEVQNAKAKYLQFPNQNVSNLSDLLETSDPGISQLLATVSRMFAAKEKLTGNGKLDLSDLVVAVAAIIQNDDTAYEALDDNKQTPASLVQTSNTVRTTGGKKATTLTVNIGGTNQARGSADWARKEAIKGATVAKGVSADNGFLPEKYSFNVEVKDKIKNEIKSKPISEVRFSSNPEAASDQTVRKLVYSQYRDMLKNYSSTD